MLKRILKWTGIVLGGLIAVLLIANAVFVWRSSAALEKRLQAVRDEGRPVRLADLARAPTPPEQNAAVYLRRARQDLTAIGKDLSAFYESEAYKKDRLGPAEVKTLEDVLEAYPQAVSLLEQAVAASDYDPEPDYSLSFNAFVSASIDDLGNLRAAARLLNYRAMVLLAHGKRDEALGRAVDLFRLARHCDKQPMLVGYLVAIAVRGVGVETANRVLRSGPVATAARDALDAELARHDLSESYRQALISERALGLTAFRDQNLGRFWPARGFWNNAVIYYLDMMESQLALASQPYHKVLQAGPPAISKPVSPWTVLADLVLPAVGAARQATERCRATMRCLGILNAATRLEQQGVEATGLGDLKLPEQQTIDPFTGKPLLMKELPEGWVVYSVGMDLKDDGGQVDDLADFGLGPVPPLSSLE